jgi:hypothetical protein
MSARDKWKGPSGFAFTFHIGKRGGEGRVEILKFVDTFQTW